MQICTKDRNVATRTCLAQEGCNRQASFGNETARVPMFCQVRECLSGWVCKQERQRHKETQRQRNREGVSVCRFLTSSHVMRILDMKRPAFQFFCRCLKHTSTHTHTHTLTPAQAHKEPSHINVLSIKCRAPQCTRQPLYGAPSVRVPIYCSQHRRLTDINVRSKKCEVAACTKQPSFGDPDRSPPLARFCFQHRPSPAFVNLVARVCEAEGCSSRPSFATREGPVRWCAIHRPPDSVNLYSTKCKWEGGCSSQASCGFPGEKRGVLCSAHKLPGMVRLWGMCQFLPVGGGIGCHKSASFGLKSEGVRRFCRDHRDDLLHVYLHDERSKVRPRKRKNG